MNIVRFECRRYLGSSFIWALCLTIFGYVCIQLFVSFTQDMKFLETMLQAYSPEVLKAFGAQMETIKTLPGFYSFCLMYIIAAAAFQSTYLGLHVVGKEISGKSADFIFTKPVKRSTILTMKLCSIIVCLLIMNVVYCLGTLWAAYMTGLAYDMGMMITLNSAMFLTQFLFLSLGFFLSCVVKKVKTPITFTTGIVCSFFLLQMLVNVEPDGILSYISFLSYVSPDSIVAHGGFEVVKLGILLLLSVGFLTSGYILFQRRDIHAW